uniref:Uncharacterized protein n=1 Tax=Timema shepardi TaxID=629360 RepID=A0A7R9FVJ3_TIMSH|nr:unnamed protein product [Timema shepardi]
MQVGKMGCTESFLPTHTHTHTSPEPLSLLDPDHAATEAGIKTLILEISIEFVVLKWLEYVPFHNSSQCLSSVLAQMTCLTAPVDTSLELLAASPHTLIASFSSLSTLIKGNSEKDGKPVIQTFPKQSEAGATRKVEMTLTATYPSVGGFYTSCLRAARRHLDYLKRPCPKVPLFPILASLAPYLVARLIRDDAAVSVTAIIQTRPLKIEVQVSVSSKPPWRVLRRYYTVPPRAALWPYSSRGPDSWFTIDFRFLRVFADYSRLKAELLVCGDSNSSLSV